MKQCVGCAPGSSTRAVAEAFVSPGAGALQVSLNGGPLQPLSFLARLRPDELASIQFLNSTDATQRFGTSAGTGSVLLVKNK